MTAAVADPVPGLRERKKVATRRALAEAAIGLAVERGLDNVRVEDIAAAADVSPRTFNNYFASKADAICALGLDRADRMQAALRARPAGESLWEAIRAVVVAEYATGDGVTLSRDWMHRLQLVLTAPALHGSYLAVNAAIQRALAEAIAERIDPHDTDEMLPEILAGVVIVATQVALRRWIEADPPVAPGPLVERALDLLMAGLASSAADRSPGRPVTA